MHLFTKDNLYYQFTYFWEAFKTHLELLLYNFKILRHI